MDFLTPLSASIRSGRPPKRAHCSLPSLSASAWACETHFAHSSDTAFGEMGAAVCAKFLTYPLQIVSSSWCLGRASYQMSFSTSARHSGEGLGFPLPPPWGEKSRSTSRRAPVTISATQERFSHEVALVVMAANLCLSHSEHRDRPDLIPCSPFALWEALTTSSSTRAARASTDRSLSACLDSSLRRQALLSFLHRSTSWTFCLDRTGNFF
mmetsp:Transcript_7817/g.28345  ORF Transcript_7817/g.28345 Transcript_7817/m.28345 type:complete len:211 (-) Transcript_7817:637-1269(-)